MLHPFIMSLYKLLGNCKKIKITDVVLVPVYVSLSVFVDHTLKIRESRWRNACLTSRSIEVLKKYTFISSPIITCSSSSLTLNSFFIYSFISLYRILLRFISFFDLLSVVCQKTSIDACLLFILNFELQPVLVFIQ